MAGPTSVKSPHSETKCSQDASALVTLWLTCGFIFKLKKKIIVIYDLKYFAIPFQIKDRTLKFVTSYKECFQAA